MKRLSKLLVATVIVATVASGAILIAGFTTKLPTGSSGNGVTTNSQGVTFSKLPPGCVKPANGFLIIANQQGFNNSIGHGAPTKPWPVITVQKGSTVDIVVCNGDVQAHGFQVEHYFDSNIETVEPGQVVHVSFVVTQAGTFEIYCSIFCSIHIYMQSGQLVVNS